MYILVLVAVLVFGLMLYYYNSLVAMRQLTRNAWADTDVYLKRRAELIPNLVASVKGYAAHEQSTFENLAAARTQSASPCGPDCRAS